MSVMLSAASCVDWAVKLTGAKDAAELLSKVEKRRALDGPEIFLPYLSGERTPHNDPAARGVLFGLNHDSDAAAIGQAVLEGVASRSLTVSTCSSKPAPPSTRFPSSAAARAPCGGAACWPRPQAAARFTAMPPKSARRFGAADLPG
jgi:hypothetical protein